MDPPVTADYQKPFYLFHYNKPKQPALRRKKGVDYRQKPDKPIRLNNATKMRNKVIREYTSREKEPFVDYRALSHETAKLIVEQPQVVPRDTNASQFRYKWVREVPVVPCRFTEHVMMFKKPPFTHEKPTGRCGQYRLRNMELKAPQRVIEEQKKTDSGPLIPSILQ